MIYCTCHVCVHAAITGLRVTLKPFHREDCHLQSACRFSLYNAFGQKYLYSLYLSRELNTQSEFTHLACLRTTQDMSREYVLMIEFSILRKCHVNRRFAWFMFNFKSIGLCVLSQLCIFYSLIS